MGRDQHGGYVAGAQIRIADIDVEALHQRVQRLAGKGRVPQCIARPVEAYDQAVSDELVVAHALNVSDVLDARIGVHRSNQEQAEGENGEKTDQHGARFSAWVGVRRLTMRETCQVAPA